MPSKTNLDDYPIASRDYWRIKDIVGQCSVSRTSLDRYRQKLDFPKPSMIGDSLLWRRKAVLDWFDKFSTKEAA